jgi:hypothetical protein
LPSIVAPSAVAIESSWRGLCDAFGQPRRYARRAVNIPKPFHPRHHNRSALPRAMRRTRLRGGIDFEETHA